MVETARYEFEGLSTRDGFNRSLRHFKTVGEVIGDFEGERNLADLLNELLEQKQLEMNQIDPIVHALLVGHPKYPYASCSLNLPETITDFKALVEETGRWTAVDIVIAYHHPDLGLTMINPKNEAHWAAAQSLKKNELVTIYRRRLRLRRQGRSHPGGGREDGRPAARPEPATPPAFTKGSFKPPRAGAPRPRGAATRAARASANPQGGVHGEEGGAVAAGAPAPAAAAAPVAAAPAGRPSRMTPMYSIPVTNELFHNGNVEAWKRIIASYKAKHPGLDVFIFYEGERIHDINTLFKWGKVKHGSAIMIAVAGDDIQEVAKLQRYLRQGASPMFEAFLRFPVNTVLNLF